MDATTPERSPLTEALARLDRAMRPLRGSSLDPERRRVAARLADLARCEDDELAAFAGRHLPGRAVDEPALRAAREMILAIGRVLGPEGESAEAMGVLKDAHRALDERLAEAKWAAARREAEAAAVAAAAAAAVASTSAPALVEASGPLSRPGGGLPFVPAPTPLAPPAMMAAPAPLAPPAMMAAPAPLAPPALMAAPAPLAVPAPAPLAPPALMAVSAPLTMPAPAPLGVPVPPPMAAPTSLAAPAPTASLAAPAPAAAPASAAAPAPPAAPVPEPAPVAASAPRTEPPSSRTEPPSSRAEPPSSRTEPPVWGESTRPASKTLPEMKRLVDSALPFIPVASEERPRPSVARFDAALPFQPVGSLNGTPPHDSPPSAAHQGAATPSPHHERPPVAPGPGAPSASAPSLQPASMPSAPPASVPSVPPASMPSAPPASASVPSVPPAALPSAHPAPVASVPPASAPAPASAGDPSSTRSAPALTLNQYAGLVVACELYPAHVESTHARYGVPTPAARAALDAFWASRLAADPALAQRWPELCEAARRYFLQSR
ncbi:hypothetical protein [Sorangium sp. So ce1078]|uniref:hypothetical protein n=1 Tax=Sorangium sp. So ce1078 TaxID=3133329 RepID=UPI003F607F8A